MVCLYKLNATPSAKCVFLTGGDGDRGRAAARRRSLLVDAVVHQQLRDQRGEEGDGDPQPEAASRTVKRPPQAQGQGR